MDERAATPVVGKALEVAILVVFVGLVSAALFGSVVPSYRTAAGAEVADRALVSVTGQLETAAETPPAVDSHRVELSYPRTIRGEAYALRTREQNGTSTLELDHPNPHIGGTIRLSLPNRVAEVSGSVQSTEGAVVVVTTRVDGRIEVRLQ